ncbi:hypothetical protein PTKIN_Ptkin07bG0080600 [Pterospermum kingtungense]
MASNQASRRENTTTERESYIEKHRVPKMTTHFESLAEKAIRDSDAKETPQPQAHAHAHALVADQNPQHRPSEFESLAEKVGNITAQEEEEDKARKGREKELGGGTRGPNLVIGKFEVGVEDKNESSDRGANLSVEEIGQLRASAQQNSAEAIRAAEERYNKPKESAKEKGSQEKESHLQSTQHAEAKDNVVQGAQNVALQAKDTILESAKRTSETKDVATEKIQHGYVATKDSLVSAGKTVVDYTAPKAAQAKDYALQTAVKAKDTAVDVSKNIASYAGEKAIATKDVTIEKGKGVAELAGEVAVDVKDKAVAAGWHAAHYTTEKAVEGTKVAAGVVEGVAEYAGHKAVEIASKPLGAAKEAAAAAGETMIQYTARKKEESERELEAKRSSTKIQQGIDESRPQRQVENREQRPTDSQQHEDISKKMTQETYHGLAGEDKEEDQTGVLGAIGETIVEIAQTTKDLVIGPSPEEQKTERDNNRQ